MFGSSSISFSVLALVVRACAPAWGRLFFASSAIAAPRVIGWVPLPSYLGTACSPPAALWTAALVSRRAPPTRRAAARYYFSPRAELEPAVSPVRVRVGILPPLPGNRAGVGSCVEETAP